MKDYKPSDSAKPDSKTVPLPIAREDFVALRAGDAMHLTPSQPQDLGFIRLV